MSYLRKELNSQEATVIRKCRLADSRSDTLLQAVDMIAGSIRRAYELNETKYKSIIQKRIKDEWNFS